MCSKLFIYKQFLAPVVELEKLKYKETKMYEDKNLVCEDCGKEFVFSAGEQEFYAQKGLVNVPKRCPECRVKRRQKSRRMYEAVCSECGAATKVPFKPVEGREIFCKACFAKKNESANQ